MKRQRLSGSRIQKGKSKARKSKGKGKARASAASSNGNELDSREVEQPRKKRKTAIKQQSRSKKGKGIVKFEWLSSLPVELFAEIVSYCTPGDLLALSRCSKTFRALLISSNSASLWKAARRTVDLPKLKAKAMNEQRYAHLVFGTRCQLCGKGNTQHADYSLRIRLCMSCRKEKWVKLTQIEESHPELHPKVVQVCLYTGHSACDPRRPLTMPGLYFGFLDDLERLSEKLFELGARVEEEEEKYAYSDDELTSSALELRRYLKKRTKLRIAARKDGRAIHAAVRDLRSEKAEQRERTKVTSEIVSYSRRRAIERKVLALDDVYNASDFSGAWYTSKIVNEPRELTDEDWDANLKGKVIKLLARLGEREAQNMVGYQLEDRQDLLRPRYQKLLDTQPSEQAGHEVPLFADFLRLDSVKPLWEPEDADADDDDVWAEHLDAILDELADYREVVRLQAIKTVLRATTDMSEEDLDGNYDDFSAENGYDAAWFDRPISFLVCNLPDCRVYRRRDYSNDRPHLIEARPAFFGCLRALLAHQHEDHDHIVFSDPLLSQRKEEGVLGHFHLPPLVVSALSSVIAIAGVDDAEATLDDLDNVTLDDEPWRNPLDAYLEHENASGSKKYHESWRHLIEECITQSEVAAKSGRVLEVPSILLHDRVARENSSPSEVESGSLSPEAEVKAEDEWW